MLYFTLAPRSLGAFYTVAAVLGFASGYWAVFATIAAEQFGTNLRATAATTAPNIVRWSAAGTAWLWLALADSMPAWQSAAIVAALVLPVAFLAVFGLRESYGTDLDFQEE